MTVRRQKLADVRAVSRVRARAWRAAYAGLVPGSFLDAMEPTPGSVARDEERFRARGDDVHSFIAHQDAAVVGFAVAGPDRDVGPPAGEIWAIYVDPLHWGRGIGGILLGTAVDALRETNRDPIALWVLEDNAAARGFYEHEGFVWTGERRQIDLGASLPEIKYELRGRSSQPGASVPVVAG